MPEFADGGIVGPYDPDSDSIPAMLGGGCVYADAELAAIVFPGQLKRINDGDIEES